MEDVVAPELFRAYTLANGKRMVGGISQRTTGNWKYVEFPMNFSEIPLVFPQVISNNDNSAVLVRLRNISIEGFEMKLQEEENASGDHGVEQVAWMAMESGNVNSAFLLESGVLPNIDQNSQALGFTENFTGLPAFISAIQTYNEVDPASLRFSALSLNSVNLFIQEEQSLDAEMTHASEEVAYLAVDPGTMVDEDGTVFGETGSLNLNQNWQTVNLSREYNKTVVVLGGIESGR